MNELEGVLRLVRLFHRLERFDAQREHERPESEPYPEEKEEGREERRNIPAERLIGDEHAAAARSGAQRACFE